MKILVVSSSRHGSTDQIADVIVQRLREAGLTVDSAHPEDVTDVEGYDAFVLGSAVYMTQWTPQALDFAKRFRGELAAHPVWAFSVGLHGATTGAVGDPLRVGPVLLALDPEDHVTFPGRFSPGDLSLRERTVARLGGASEGDYRDWDAVRDWADAIATTITSNA